MSKGNLNLGDFQKLSKEEQRNISGSLSAVRCNSPYLTPNGVCEPGDFPHPTLGHCVCCSA